MTEAAVVDRPALTPAQQRAIALAEDLLKDSKVGSVARARAKELFPDAGIAFPEDRFEPVLAPLMDENKTLRERLEAIETERKTEKEAAEQAKIDAAFDQRLTAAKTKYSLNSEGFDKMVERMRETQNYQDAEAAAAWVVQNAPKPQVAPKGGDWAPKSMDLFGSKNKVDDDAFRLLHNDPQEYQDQQLALFVADPIGFTNETLGF